MYKNITNPNTGKIVPLNSQKGQKILKNYIDTIKGGGISVLEFIKEVNKTQNYSVFFDYYLNGGISMLHPTIETPPVFDNPALPDILEALPNVEIFNKYRNALNSTDSGLQLLERLAFPQPQIYGSKKANIHTFYWCLIFIMYLLTRLAGDQESIIQEGKYDDGEEFFIMKIILKDELIYPLLVAISQYTYILARGTNIGNSKLIRAFVDYNNNPIEFKAMYQFVNKELQPLFVYKCSNNYGCGRCIQHSSSDVKGQQIVFNSTTEFDDICDPIYIE